MRTPAPITRPTAPARSSSPWAVAVLLALACESHPPPSPHREALLPPSSATVSKEPDDPRIVCPPGSKQRRTEGDRTITVRCLDTEGRLHGPGREWATSGQLLFDETAIHGKREGVARACASSGQLIDENGYREGKLEGVGRTWYPRRAARTGADQLFVEYPCHEGRVEGVARTWHPNGRLRAVATFRGNDLVGAVRAWDENGRRVAVKDPEEYFPMPSQLRRREQER